MGSENDLSLTEGDLVLSLLNAQPPRGKPSAQSLMQLRYSGGQSS